MQPPRSRVNKKKTLIFLYKKSDLGHSSVTNNDDYKSDGHD